MAIYRSKISWWLVAFLAAVFGSSIIPAIKSGEPEGLLVLIPVILFIIHMYLNTNYTIENNDLIIRCGFYKKKLNISTIRKAEDTNNILSSPALSLDRLELFYNGYDSVIISPKNKAVFVAHLQKINPDVVYKQKHKK